MNLFDIYESVSLSPCANIVFPYTLKNNMRVIAYIYWPILDLEPQWTFIIGYPFEIHASAMTYTGGSSKDIYDFRSVINYVSTENKSQLVISGKEYTQSSHGNGIYIGNPTGNCSLILDRYNEGTYYPRSSVTFSNYYYTDSEYCYSTEYETLDPDIINTPFFDQNGIWYWNSGSTDGGNPQQGIQSFSTIALFNNVSISSVNCGKVILYSVSIQEYNASSNIWTLVDSYVPCIYNNGSQNGVLGMVNSTRSMFSSIYDFPGTCSSYVNNVVPPGPEDDFKELFHVDVTKKYRFYYNNGESPVESFRAFKTLEALQAFIADNNVHIGELISVVDDGQNNGVYTIVYGVNNALTYRKLKLQ